MELKTENIMSKKSNEKVYPSRRGVQDKKITPARRGIVFFITDRCKGCNLCIDYCPMGVLKQSEDFNMQGYHYPILVEEEPDKVCIACGFCTLICPDFAIYSKPIDEVTGNESPSESIIDKKA